MDNAPPSLHDLSLDAAKHSIRTQHKHRRAAVASKSHDRTSAIRDHYSSRIDKLRQEIRKCECALQHELTLAKSEEKYLTKRVDEAEVKEWAALFALEKDMLGGQTTCPKCLRPPAGEVLLACSVCRSPPVVNSVLGGAGKEVSQSTLERWNEVRGKSCAACFGKVYNCSECDAVCCGGCVESLKKCQCIRGVSCSEPCSAPLFCNPCWQRASRPDPPSTSRPSPEPNAAFRRDWRHCTCSKCEHGQRPRAAARAKAAGVAHDAKSGGGGDGGGGGGASQIFKDCGGTCDMCGARFCCLGLGCGIDVCERCYLCYCWKCADLHRCESLGRRSEIFQSAEESLMSLIERVSLSIDETDFMSNEEVSDDDEDDE